MKTNIRLVTEEDLPEVAKVYAETFNSAFPNEDWTVGSAKELLSYLYKAHPDLFFVAQKEDEIVGGIAGIIKPWWNGESFADGELFVKTIHQNRGVGKGLLKKALETAIEKYQISGMEGITNGEAKFPLSWYERLGLKKTGYVHIEGNAQEILKNLS